MSFSIGIDFGATHLRAGVVHVADGSIYARAKIETHGNEGVQPVIARIAALCEQIVAESGVPRSNIRAVGIGAPGHVDLDSGITRFLPNLPADWVNVPLAAQLEARTGFRVALLNDARALTLGEFSFGAGRGATTMVCFTIGTGVGGGLVINKKLYLANGGAAGEIGHQVVARDGLPCTCGGRGCLEVYASGPAIAAQGVRAVLTKQPTCLADWAKGDLNRITTAMMFQAAEHGDTVVREIFDRTGEYIGIAASNMVVAIAPDKIVFGGGVMQAGEWLLGPIRRTVRERVHLTPTERTEIVAAKLGDEAGVLGAAIWASERFA